MAVKPLERKIRLEKLQWIRGGYLEEASVMVCRQGRQTLHPIARKKSLISRLVLFNNGHSIRFFIQNSKSFEIKTESTRKLSNFNFQWTKSLYQNNLKNIAFFVTFLKG